MAQPCDTLEADIQHACDYPATVEVEQKVLLIPTSLDVTFTFDPTYDHDLITDITLASGTGYLIEGIITKNWINDGFEYLNGNDSSAGFRHLLNGIRILDPSVEKRAEINKMAVGGDSFYAIVESKWKGAANEDAFKVLGHKFGLVIPDNGITFNSNENDGTMVLSLATRDGLKEPYMPAVFKDTDYATTKTAVWTNKLAAA